MFHSRFPLAVLLVLMFSAAVTSAGPARAQQITGNSQFSLSRVASPNQHIRVLAAHWAPGSDVLVRVRYFGLRKHRMVRVPASGSFELELSGVRWCKRLTIRVRDESGHRATLHPSSSSSGCRRPSEDTHIGIHLVTAPQPAPQPGSQQTTLDTRHPAGSYALHVGDVLYVYSSGSTAPAFLPKTDPRYLADIEHGTVPACQAGVPCLYPQGFFWRYKALQAGQTYVDLSPACRQAKPPCGAPDRVVRVTIIP